MYTLTDEATGAVLESFCPADYPANTDAIALKQAATNAKRIGRVSPVRLAGPDITERRYAPEYWSVTGNSYRLKCACGGWMHPARRGHGHDPDQCRECYRQRIPVEQKERAGTLAKHRWAQHSAPPPPD